MPDQIPQHHHGEFVERRAQRTDTCVHHDGTRQLIASLSTGMDEIQKDVRQISKMFVELALSKQDRQALHNEMDEVRDNIKEIKTLLSNSINESIKRQSEYESFRREFESARASVKSLEDSRPKIVSDLESQIESLAKDVQKLKTYGQVAIAFISSMAAAYPILSGLIKQIFHIQ